MRFVTSLLVVGLAAFAADAPPQKIRLSVERRDGAVWQAVEPKQVFEQGDRVRFRFSAGFSGYLYVMNQSTSGKYEVLFPREDTGSSNRIVAGQEYVVPATQGWFRISGPAGHDVMFWVVSPIEMHPAKSDRPTYVPLPPPPPADLPKSFKPRCDDTIFNARGDCVDSGAGARAIDPGEKLPSNLSG
ncbi:MAG: DUF4384 domain-containing protein, partial [Bryobacteraceae bacterium]